MASQPRHGRDAGRVSLRPPEPEDVAAYLSHPRSAEIVRMYGGDPAALSPRTTAEALAWLDRLRTEFWGRVILSDGVPVGALGLHSHVPHDRRARLRIGLFAEAQLGRGIGRQAIRLALDAAFGPLGLHRVDLRVLAFNHRAIRCYVASGFLHEGTERQSARVGDVWHDDWIMGLLAAEHRASRS